MIFMNKPCLTKEIPGSISPDEIIYAEIAERGAMENAGGVLIYTFTDEKLVCLTASVFTEEDLYTAADEILTDNQNTHLITSERFKDKLFEYYYASFGNHAFVINGVTLGIGADTLSTVKMK